MLTLDAEERAMLAGERGEAVRKAMEIVVALAKIYGAEELVPVSHVQVSGVSYQNLGQAGLEFLREWASQGARVRVPTTLNPAGMDLAKWQALGIPPEFAHKQGMVVDAYTAMDIQPTLTCTPYSGIYRPSYGEHIAWSESSAVSFANSVLGARTNREGGPSALAAAIVGKTPRFGLHLDSERRATYLVEVTCPVQEAADFGALGYLVGKCVRNGVPYFRFQGDRPDLTLMPGSLGEDLLKMLGAAMAASGAVALYHVEGITPEAQHGGVLSDDVPRMVVGSLDEAFSALNQPEEDLDLISIGCPHASLREIEQVAHLVEGKRLRIPLWVTTARRIQEQAERQGWVQVIEAAGGRVVADTCVVVAPIEMLGIKSIATNSAKAAFYLMSRKGTVRFGSLERCIQAALLGRWT